MNKRAIYKEIVTILDDLEGAKRLTVSAASSHKSLTELAARLDEEAMAEEARDLTDGSNLVIDPETLRQFAEAPERGLSPALLRRAAKAIEAATAQMRAAEEAAEELGRRPSRDLDEAHEVVADLQAELAEATATAAAVRSNPIRLVRRQYPDARITIEFPACLEPSESDPAPGDGQGV